MNKSTSLILDAQLFAYIVCMKEFESKTDSDNKTKKSENKDNSKKTKKNNI